MAVDDYRATVDWRLVCRR